jgi:8-oxo-dGTP pyrophosphatase MutT (NUDIX family)
MRGLLGFLYTLEVPRLGEAPLQAGALCWRLGAEGLEVLLVTSRRSGKWGVPKGWALAADMHRTAQREAWEAGGRDRAAENRC